MQHLFPVLARLSNFKCRSTHLRVAIKCTWWTHSLACTHTQMYTSEGRWNQTIHRNKKYIQRDDLISTCVVAVNLATAPPTIPVTAYLQIWIEGSYLFINRCTASSLKKIFWRGLVTSLCKKVTVQEYLKLAIILIWLHPPCRKSPWHQQQSDHHITEHSSIILQSWACQDPVATCY